MSVHEPPIEQPTLTVSDERALGRLLGVVLRVGITISAALVVTGMVMFFADDASRAQSVDDVLGKTAGIEALQPGDIVDGVRDARPTAWIELGLLVLILTPITRVAMTVWFFARTRERILTMMALLVLLILVLGILGIGLE